MLSLAARSRGSATAGRTVNYYGSRFIACRGHNNANPDNNPGDNDTDGNIFLLRQPLIDPEGNYGLKTEITNNRKKQPDKPINYYPQYMGEV
jgi:hypothetical protein